MAKATRTLNPLPLQDLEPHRFEDLVRQLAYDFRRWRSLEATGRSGSDEGVDILGSERLSSDVDEVDVQSASTEPDDGDETDRDEPETTEEMLEKPRLWVFQCKREKSIGPAQVKKIIKDFFAGKTETPYGYVLAAACDFSVKARTAFREELAARGVMEFYMWGKGELEDMLVLPKNDNLLFAYFGISLRVRRASARTLVRSRLSLKRRIVKAIGGIHHDTCHAILVRDPADDTYPYVGDRERFLSAPRWAYWEFVRHEPPDHLMFATKTAYAYADWSTGEWDWIKGSDAKPHSRPEVSGCKTDHTNYKPDERNDICEAFWEMRVPAENKARLNEYRFIHYDRVLAYDEIGDSHNEGPHLLVDYRNDDPFESRFFYTITFDLYGFEGRTILPNGPEDPKHIRFFPDEMPDLREEWDAERRRRFEEATKQK